jgi:dihydrofolate reductase
VFRELMSTGAVITGRRTFELAGPWQDDHHDGVPIFVLTHHIDEADPPPGSAKFVSDVEDCAAQALLRAGLLDEMEIHLVHVILGNGRRLFDALGPGQIELDLLRRLEARDVLHP